MNVADINVGDEVRVRGPWMRVTHIEADLIVGRCDDGSPNSHWAAAITEHRRPKHALGYEPVEHDSWYTSEADASCFNNATYVVTHWSDGTCTLDTIAAFREAHQ